jgi:hypothetical protein
MSRKEYNAPTFGHLVGEVVSALMMAKAKYMLSKPEIQKEALADALQPFLNLHNISLLLSEKNINKVRGGIIKSLAKMDQHYLFHTEPTADLTDIFYQVSCRPGGGADNTVVPVYSGYLSQVTQEQIMTLISKFFNNGNTGNTAAIGTGAGE